MLKGEVITWARRYGQYALLERIRVGNPNNDKIRGLVAKIRAGNGDDRPEVRSVLLYINENCNVED